MTYISKTRRAVSPKLCKRNAFIDIMTHAKFHFNWLMLAMIIGIQVSEPPLAWRTTDKAVPDRVNSKTSLFLSNFLLIISQSKNYYL